MTKMTRLKRPLTLPLGLGVALVLAACGQSASPAATPSTAPPATHGHATAGHPASPDSSAPSASSPVSAGRNIAITVKGKQITPAPGITKIAVGEELLVTVTSDHDDQMHAHGFEIEKDIKAGQPMTFSVTGGPTGVFDVELHNPELRIMQIAVS